jgi:hypothetical protein
VTTSPTSLVGGPDQNTGPASLSACGLSELCDPEPRSRARNPVVVINPGSAQLIGAWRFSRVYLPVDHLVSALTSLTHFPLDPLCEADSDKGSRSDMTGKMDINARYLSHLEVQSWCTRSCCIRRRKATPRPYPRLLLAPPAKMQVLPTIPQPA